MSYLKDTERAGTWEVTGYTDRIFTSGRDARQDYEAKRKAGQRPVMRKWDKEGLEYRWEPAIHEFMLQAS